MFLYIFNNSLLKNIIDISKHQKIYFNPKFKQSIIDLKLKQEKSEISIIGTSRTSGFEKEMFKNSNVYNYCMIAWSLDDALNLIKSLEIEKGGILIFGIDQWNFNKNYSHRLTNSFKKNNLNIPYLFIDQEKGYANITLIGEKAAKNFSGFRSDGSYFDGKRFISSEKELIEAGIWPGKIAHKDNDFYTKYYRIIGSEVDYKQIEKIKKILVLAKERKISIFGFFPPFSPSVIKKLDSENLDFSFIYKSSKELKNMFSDFGFVFKDFTNFKFFDDTFYLDGSHPNRNVYFRILKELGIQTNHNFKNNFQIEINELNLLKKYFKTDY